MRIGTSYKQHPGLKGDWDAIVIGSGSGGLTTAASLAKLANKRVLVLERHYTAGGFTHTFRRPGYEWDVGIHYIGEVAHPKAMARRIIPPNKEETNGGTAFSAKNICAFLTVETTFSRYWSIASLSCGKYS